MNPAAHLYIALLPLSLPALAQRGKDGYACVHRHASHAIFNATWGTVVRVADTGTPQNSLILRKPTSTAESEGVAGARTIAEWIKGPRVDQGPPSGSRARWNSI